MKTILKTERLILRPLSPEEEDGFVLGIAEAELRRMYGFPAVLSEETARRIFSQFSNLSTAYGIFRRSDGAFAGFLLDVSPELPANMLNALPAGGRTLAFAIFSPWQRQGYMKEAISALIEHHTQAGIVPYLHAGPFSFNKQSQRLLHSLGFTPYGQHAQGTVTIVDEICFL